MSFGLRVKYIYICDPPLYISMSFGLNVGGRSHLIRTTGSFSTLTSNFYLPTERVDRDPNDNNHVKPIKGKPRTEHLDGYE